VGEGALDAPRRRRRPRASGRSAGTMSPTRATAAGRGRRRRRFSACAPCGRGPPSDTAAEPVRACPADPRSVSEWPRPACPRSRRSSPARSVVLRTCTCFPRRWSAMRRAPACSASAPISRAAGTAAWPPAARCCQMATRSGCMPTWRRRVRPYRNDLRREREPAVAAAARGAGGLSSAGPGSAGRSARGGRGCCPAASRARSGRRARPASPARPRSRRRDRRARRRTARSRRGR
jgi:hypothetical protein